MKKNIFKWFLLALPLLAGGLVSCEDDEGSSLTAVTNVSYEPTAGGAVITFTAPLNNDLLYGKAVYTCFFCVFKYIFNITAGVKLQCDFRIF